jgi:hypothetical protein
MIAMRTVVVAALMTGALLGRLWAQQPPLALGQRVRIFSSADGAVRTGGLVLVLADTLVLSVGGRHESFRRGSNDRMEVLASRHTFALAGAILGAGIGTTMGTTRSRHFCTRQIPSLGTQYCGLKQPEVTIAFGLGGLLVGALVGKQFGQAFWEPVPSDQLDRLQVSLRPQAPGRLAFSVSMAF